MFRKIEDFIQIWKSEAERTAKLLDLIPDSALKRRPVAELRTIGKLAWHIIETPVEMLERTGITIEGPMWGGEPPETMREILAVHRQVTESTIAVIGKEWNDLSLDVQDEMYGEMWDRRQTLTCLLLHTIHHRGQLTVLMRAAGLEVIGLYGPAKQEWKAMGLEPME